MKKLFGLVLSLAVMLSVFVSAAGDDLDPKHITMAETDTRYVEYCVFDITPEDLTIDIIVDPVCRDQNSISGCQAADDNSPADFSATPVSPTLSLVGGAGCVDIELTTSDANGLFYYTVNGDLGGVITSETGTAYVPEFGTIGAVLALLGAGAYAAKKRRN